MKNQVEMFQDCRAFQVPFIVDLNKPKKRREIEERQYYSQIKSINRRIGDVGFFHKQPVIS